MAKIKRYLAYTVAFMGALFIFLFSRRGETIKDLKDQLVVNKITNELASITEQSKKSNEDYEVANRRYAELKRTHPEYFGKG